LAKGLLERYDWWQFEPHPEWVEPCGSPEHLERPFAAGIAGTVRVIYFYGPNFSWDVPFFVHNFELDIPYQAFFWDPRTGQPHPLGKVTPSADGVWPIPIQPEFTDWVLVIEKQEK
jgi:hypothetical protein